MNATCVCAKAGAQHTCVKAVHSIKKYLWWALVVPNAYATVSESGLVLYI